MYSMRFLDITNAENMFRSSKEVSKIDLDMFKIQL